MHKEIKKDELPDIVLLTGTQNMEVLNNSFIGCYCSSAMTSLERQTPLFLNDCIDETFLLLMLIILILANFDFLK